jgi:hypothetical protein
MKKDDLQELATDYLEIGLDKAVKVGSDYLPVFGSIAEEVPLVKTALAVLTAPTSISDVMLGNKICEFLYNTELDQEKLDKLRSKLKSKKYEKLMRNLMHSINAHDQEERSQITGRLFRALLNEEITHDQYSNLQHVTNTINLNILSELKDYYTLKSRGATGHLSILESNGLISINSMNVGGWSGGNETSYPPTELGWKYAGIVFDHEDTAIKGVKMGQGELHTVLTESGLPSSEAYPIDVIEDRKLLHAQVVLYIVGEDFVIGSKNGMPDPIDQAKPPLGLSNDEQAQRLVERVGLPNKPKPKLIYMKNDATTYKYVYTVVNDPKLFGQDSCSFIEILNNMHNWPNPNQISDFDFGLADSLVNYQRENPDAIYGVNDKQ